MERQSASETYKGRKVTADAYQESSTIWSWTYLINGTLVGMSAKHAMLPTAEEALERALLAARARIDGA